MLINTLPPLIKNVTCAITGHRILCKDFDREKLYEELSDIVDDGYEYFLDGMALGFDSECFRALERIRGDGKPVKIVAVIPCSGQSEKFSLKDKTEYDRMINSADFVVKEGSCYFEGCMLRRNDFLVENASLLFAYYRDAIRGGTRYTVNRAVELGLPVRRFICPASP